MKTGMYKKNDKYYMSIEQLKLKSNPFRLTPSIDSKEIIWAGFPTIKEKIKTRIKRSINIPNSSLILNWGEYGSGKTHASRYFNKLDVLKELAGINTIPFSINLSFPKSKEPVKELYTQIIDRIDFVELRRRINDKLDNPIAIAHIVTSNTLIRQILCLLFNNDINLMEMQEYLYGGSNRKLSSKGITRRLLTDNDYIDLISGLFSLLTYEKRVYSVIILWIDEFEDISILNTSNISNINNFVRSLIDKASNNLLLFLNLTQSAMMDVEDLGEYLQEAVKSRIKERIEFNMPNSFELKEYLEDLLNNSLYRDEKCNGDQRFFPFNEDIIDQVIKDLGNTSLRRYNEAFSLLLENAIYDKKDIIDTAYYDTIKNEIIGWK